MSTVEKGKSYLCKDNVIRRLVKLEDMFIIFHEARLHQGEVWWKLSGSQSTKPSEVVALFSGSMRIDENEILMHLI
jgi:hypothetical protein